MGASYEVEVYSLRTGTTIARFTVDTAGEAEQAAGQRRNPDRRIGATWRKVP